MKKHISLILLFAIIIIGAFLRLYRIGDYMTFLGDEGRDALIVKRMIVDHEITLLGPITSVGLMHLGPIYYYFMIPFLWIFRLDPIGPAIMVASFSLATIVLIWKICEEFFNQKAALIASLLYAISPLAIVHAHSSWNPNILPFWGLLLIYSLMKVIIKKDYRWNFLIGISLGVSLQLHYIALVYIPIIIVSFLIARFHLSLRNFLLLIIGTLTAISPYILFELRHQLTNTQTVYQFVTRTGDTKTFYYLTFFDRFWDLSVRLFWRLIVIVNAEIAIVFMFVVLGICGYFLLTTKSEQNKKALAILFIWFLVGISTLSFYTGTIFDYYLMFAFPLPFLLTAVALSKIINSLWTKLVVILILTALIFFEMRMTPILKEPNRLATQAKEISQFILKKSDNHPYNFALIAAGNSDHAYRYYLEIGGNAPVVIKNETDDPQRSSVTQELYVVCEEKICQPLGHPLWEIAGFGRAEIGGEWQVGLFKIFKLVHYNPSLI